MADITALSKRQPDLLVDADVHSAVQSAIEGMRTLQLPHRNAAEAPQAAMHTVAHELAAENSRRVPTIASVVEERRLLGGRPASEHYINELFCASQINRGPPGFSTSSRLHFEMLLGLDEKITPADYLSFEHNARW
ncbi:Protein Y57E12AL.6 [Aphelenchoides avenae]|nr:Protein Y57E12AL.6 [Aphelenchus avenae]